MKASELRRIIREEIRKVVHEKIEYPDGLKTSGDKMLDKFSKLIDSKESKTRLGTGYVQALGVNFMGVSGVNIVVNDKKDHYLLRITSSKAAGDYRLEKSNVKTADDIYDECQSIAQAGKTKKSEKVEDETRKNI